ncbi:hypothetical protein NpNSSI1_00004450 [Neofusicoccum parvum]|nr:hypothetical protein NpNSSI1_00004450 [Neofusicoccum parvum]
MPGSLRRTLGHLHLRSRFESAPSSPSDTTDPTTPSDPASVSPNTLTPVSPAIILPVSPPSSAPATSSVSHTASTVSGQPATASSLRPSSATYQPGSTPRAVLCRHIVPTPSTPSTTLPNTCTSCTLLEHVHTSQRTWRTARSVWGGNHHRTKEAKAAYHRTKCAHANHLAAQPASPTRSRSPAARAVSFAADVADTEGARHRRQFCRLRGEYAPGRWTGDLLDTSGSEVPAEVFYAEPEEEEEEEGRGMRSFSRMVALRLRTSGTRVMVGFLSKEEREGEAS